MWIADAVRTKETQDRIHAPERQLTEREHRESVSSVKKQENTGHAEWAEKDTVTISAQAQTMIEAKRDKKQAQRQEYSMLQQMLETQKEQEKNQKSALKYFKCFQIAMRYAAGDEVPAEDLKFLQKNNNELFLKVLKMRLPKPEPKKYKTLLSKEEKDSLNENPMQEMNQADGEMDMAVLFNEQNATGLKETE